jgi:hypothetical protein
MSDPEISVERQAATVAIEAGAPAAEVVSRGAGEPFRAADEEVFRAAGAEASRAGEEEDFRGDTGNRKI